METFMKEVKLGQCGLSYAVVAIIGPQSGGKSTLLNNLFGTNFKEMDVFKGKSQTTKGIWMAHCVGIEPCTLVMDIEGSDGRERGEDDTAFKKQSALFALAVSDIVIINMWEHDIGREQGSCNPLLKIVFQAMVRLFSPRKTTLIFVIRDKSRAPLTLLELDLRKDIQKIWDSVTKPPEHKETPLSDFFNVEVVGLPNSVYEEVQFKEQVANLRQRFFHSTDTGGLAGDRRGVVVASGFAISTQEIWIAIKEHKDLDQPAQKVLLANLHCHEIANKKFSSFETKEESGKKLSLLIDVYLSEYDAETEYFEEDVRSSIRKELEGKLLEEARHKKHMKQKSVAKGIGIAVGTVTAVGAAGATAVALAPAVAMAGGAAAVTSMALTGVGALPLLAGSIVGVGKLCSSVKNKFN